MTKKKLLTETERIEIIRRAVQKLQGKPEPKPEPEVEPEVEAELERPSLRPRHPLHSIDNEEAEGILRRHQGHCQGRITEMADGDEEE